MANCELTQSEYMGLIYSTLIDVDFCASDHIDPDTISFFWDLQQCWSGCDREMQYLYTRREVVKMLMACNVYQVDRAESQSKSQSRSDSKSCSDGWNQSQATNYSANWADSVSESRSDSLGNSRGESQSTSQAFTESHGVQTGYSDTVGFGESLSDSLSDTLGHSESLSVGNSQSTKVDNGGIGTFSSSMDYVYDEEVTAGFGFSVGVAGAGRSATEGGIDTKSCSDDIDDGSETRFGHSQNDTRSSGFNQSTGQGSSFSFNQAVSDTFSSSVSVSDGSSEGQNTSNSTSHSESTAQSAADTRSRGTTSAQSTNQAHSESTSESKSVSTSQGSGYSFKYQQRFKHLRQMYDNLTLLIEYKTKRSESGQKISYGRFACGPICDRPVVPERVCKSRPQRIGCAPMFGDSCGSSYRI